MRLQPGGLFVLGIMLRGTLWELRELRRAIASLGVAPPALDELVQQHILASGFTLEKRIQQNADISMRMDVLFYKRSMIGVTALQQQDYPLTARAGRTYSCL